MLLPLFAQTNGPLQTLLPFIVLAALIYFFGIRPVSVQKKKQDQLHATLSVGDEVITIGAFKGTILEVHDDGYLLRLSADTTAFILKAGIARRVIQEADLIDEDWEDDTDEASEDEVPKPSTFTVSEGETPAKPDEKA